MISKGQGLQTQRRDRLDGGLNSRRSPFLLEESQCIAIRNLGFQEEGALSQRKAASLLLQTTWAGASLLPAPTLTRIIGGGTLPAGDYTIQYFLSFSPGGIAIYTSPSITSAALVGLALNDRIQIDIAPNNLGEGVGQGADGGDDPFNGGNVGPVLLASPLTFTILAKKAGDPNFTLQSAVTFSWNTASRVQRGTLSSYTTAVGTLADKNDKFPLRFLMWNPSTQQTIGITVDKAVQFAGDFSAFTRFALANDKAGNPHFWSRCPTPMFGAYLEQIPVISDNLSRPKRMHWTGSIATSNWRLLGANPPAAVPTTALNAVAGNLNGIYFYKVAFVYRDGRGDLTTLDIESNATASSAASVNVPNQKLDVTIPGSLETGLQFRRVYRTKGGGTVFFFHSDQAAGTGNLTFTDNTADAALGTTTPVNDLGKFANDVPPNKLAYLCTHLQRMFAFESSYIVDSSNRIIDFLATNVLRHTKAAASGTSESINAWSADFSYECGDATPPTGLVSHNTSLYWFKPNSIGRLFGSDETDFSPVTVLSGVGAMRFSILSVGSLIYFWEDARGPGVFDGVGWKQVGYDIQPAWDADKAAGFYPKTVWFDPERQEIHWLMTTLSFAPSADLNVALSKEYVLFIPSGAWTIYDADTTTSRSINSGERVVLASNIGRQVFTQIIANQTGQVLKDASVVAFTDEVSATVQVTAKMFFGDDWETTKQFRFLQIHYADLGSSATILIEIAHLSSQAFQTLATITGNTATSPADQVALIPIKSDLVTNLKDPGAGKQSEDRALLVRLTIAGSGIQTKIRGLSFKYKDMDDLRSPV